MIVKSQNNKEENIKCDIKILFNFNASYIIDSKHIQEARILFMYKPGSKVFVSLSRK